MIESLDKISDFCERHNKDIGVRNHTMCIYILAIKDATQVAEEKNTPIELGVLKEALLTEEAIKGYVSRAEKLVEKYDKALLEPYISRNNNNFWLNVWSSIVGSFLFSLIIVLVFYFGSEQLSTWLQGAK